jgi:dipeptidyl aminopeptidase/acylaminoacyl peptidase
MHTNACPRRRAGTARPWHTIPRWLRIAAAAAATLGLGGVAASSAAARGAVAEPPGGARTGVVAMASAAADPAAGSAARRPIAETDLFRFVWVADPQVSPDGRRVAFVRVTVDAKREGYDTAIWICDAGTGGAPGPPGSAPGGDGGAGVATGPPRPLTAGPHDEAPRWSPDGRHLAFVRRVGKTAQLFLLPLDGGEARQLTDLPDGARLPVWSPDGRTLAFLSGTSDADLAKTAAKDPKGANGAKGVAGAAGVKIAAPAAATQGTAPAAAAQGTAPATAAQEAARSAAAQGAARSAAAAQGTAPLATPAEHESDVRVITKAVFRANGVGFVDGSHPDHLWSVEVPLVLSDAAAAPPRQLTRGDFGDGQPAWSPDGTRLFFTSERDHEPYYEESTEDIYAVPAAGGEPVKVASFHGGIGNLAISPDGRRIAFEGAARHQPVQSYDQSGLWVTATQPGGEPRLLTADGDGDVGGHLVGDQHPPRANGPEVPLWSADGRAVLALAAARGRVNLRRFDAETGRSEAVTSGDHEVVSYAMTPDRSRLALVVSTPMEIGDLFMQGVQNGGGSPGAGSAAGTSGTSGSAENAGTAGSAGTVGAPGQPTRLTRFNEPLFSRLLLSAPAEISYRSFDGRQIAAWVQKPPDWQAGKRYPLILDIHGGPHSAYGYTFFHEAQWMAAKGYIVICPNPRGSTTYGQEFGNVIQYHFPGDDYKDLMAGIDELLRRGEADPQRLGVTGGSGGGLLTNWTITQTDRFAAAVAQRSIADWAAWWYAADFTLFTPRWFRGAPFEEAEDFTSRSPITYVAKVKTPLMLIEGDADYRTPPTAGGEAMFRALKYLHRPVVMVRFPGESHELSRSGQPWHRVERLQHIVRWFDKYLRGEATDLYDVH